MFLSSFVSRKHYFCAVWSYPADARLLGFAPCPVLGPGNTTTAAVRSYVSAGVRLLGFAPCPVLGPGNTTSALSGRIPLTLGCWGLFLSCSGCCTTAALSRSYVSTGARLSGFVPVLFWVQVTLQPLLSGRIPLTFGLVRVLSWVQVTLLLRCQVVRIRWR